MLKIHDLQFCPNKFNLSFKCSQCDKCFEKKSALTEHNKTHAKSNMNFIKEKCQICEKEIMHKNMKGHMHTHSKKIETEVGFASYTKENKNRYLFVAVIRFLLEEF